MNPPPPGVLDLSPVRRAELAARLAAVHERVEGAARTCGRDAAEVRLVVVTKTFPASDTVLLAQLGVRDVGESREPEASAKAAQVSAHLAGSPQAEPGPGDLAWHQVGQVQTRKASAVAQWADTVHSVDRARLVSALDSAAQRAGRRLACFLQVSLDGDPSRAGAAPEQLGGLAEAVEATEALDLVGLMAVPPAGVDPRPPFEHLARLAQRLRVDHPQAVELSAGMSGDLEAAVAVGATLVRVGRAVLGDRPPLRYGCD